jgi:hypothetical protein
MATLEIDLIYRGRLAAQQEIDLYDIGQALIGFQRSLALTTHLILNDKIITQAPFLKGAEIRGLPAADGSWKMKAVVYTVGGSLFAAGMAPKDSVIGHLIGSAYDYVISETLGFHIDYNKTLGQLYEEQQKKNNAIKKLPQTRFDSLVEKCQTAVREMHRPISKSETAQSAIIVTKDGRETRQFRHPLTLGTYEHISFTERSKTTLKIRGRVTSYNVNTYKGRIYVAKEGRPIPFELGENARGIRSVIVVTNSLRANAEERMRGEGEVEFDAYRNTSKSGRLKSYLITAIA